MKIEQGRWAEVSGWEPDAPGALGEPAQLEVALEEALAVQRRYLRQEWEGYTTTAEAGQGYLLSESAEGPTAEAWLPAMTAAVQQVDTVIESDEQQGLTLAVPIHLYGEVIGVVGFSREETERWSEGEIAAVEAIVEQVGLALENQRLFDEEQRAGFLLAGRVKELDCLNDIGRKIDESPSVPEFLQWVAERIPPAMQYPDVCVAAVEFEGQVYGADEAAGLPCQMVGGLRIGNELVGRVCIAYTEEHEFIGEESALLGDIVRRVSGYIENRRLLEQTRVALEEVEATHRLYLREQWAEFMSTQVAPIYERTRPDVAPLGDALLSEDLGDLSRAIEQAMTQREMIVQSDTGGEAGQAALVMPISLRGVVIGALGLHETEGGRRWTADEIALIEAVADQMALALENARLLEETRRRAERERLTADISAQVWASTEVDTILRTAIRELGRVLRASDGLIRLGVGEG